MDKHKQQTRLVKKDNTIYRILWDNSIADRIPVIDCLERTMPHWCGRGDFTSAEEVTEEDLFATVGITAEDLDHYDAALAQKRFTMIAPLLPVLANPSERSRRLHESAELYHISPQTIRQYLCRYLVFQDMRALAPVKKKALRPLTADEINMRWALNKYYYTQQKLPLTAVFLRMLREKYSDGMGQLVDVHPTMRQFYRFHEKYEKLQTKYISRDGIKSYQRNNRPLLGDGVQVFAPAAGWAMLDSTICDIYLINKEGQLVGRPVLVAAIDAFSGLCIGYTLGWEGGTDSLRRLTLSILEDKQELCRKHGIRIEDSTWPCKGELPGVMVTDMGSEYKSGTFEQISELGVTIVNLPSYRPELKGSVESFFHTIQGYFKPELKGRGMIEPDFQERGAHDYRRDASLTLDDFDKVLLRCIIYYNSQRVLEGFPFTEEMLDAGVKPYANALYAYGKTLPAVNLIPCTKECLIMTLLPRVEAKFRRDGLRVNGLRYKDTSEDHTFTEDYLHGSTVTVAYNPDDVSQIWLLREGQYIPFQLIERRFAGKTMEKTLTLQSRQRELILSEKENNLQARMDLAEHIHIVAEQTAGHAGDVHLEQIRQTRQKERARVHRNLTSMVERDSNSTKIG